MTDEKKRAAVAEALEAEQETPAQGGMPGEIIVVRPRGFTMWRKKDDDFVLFEDEAIYIRADLVKERT